MSALPSSRVSDEELRRLCDEATPGPWWSQGDPSLHMDGTSGGYSIESDDFPGRSAQRSVAYIHRRQGRPDAEFIAAARIAVPALLAEIERLRVVVEAAREIRDFQQAGGDLYARAMVLRGDALLLHTRDLFDLRAENAKLLAVISAAKVAVLLEGHHSAIDKLSDALSLLSTGKETEDG